MSASEHVLLTRPKSLVRRAGERNDAGSGLPVALALRAARRGLLLVDRAAGGDA